MATVENIETAETRTSSVLSTDVLIGIAGPVSPEELRARAFEAISGFSLPTTAGAGAARVALAYPGSSHEVARENAPGLQLWSYALPNSSAGALPWLSNPHAYRAIAELAARSGARACLMLSPDLAALTPGAVSALVSPLLDNRCLLSMPIYPVGKYDGLLNSGMLYPLTRSLYGKQLRQPLPLDFGVSGKMVARLAPDLARNSRSSATESILWPGIEASLSDCSAIQVHVGDAHIIQNDTVNLTTVIGQLAGSLFEGIEREAAIWQRVRGSQPVPILGAATASADGEDIDVRPLIESFTLGSRNLQEIWSLVLPPVTLLELKRLSRLTPEQFRMPDGIWARIVYDFALAHRLRTISRSHLMGALTPLYLGWVGSYAAEVKALDVQAVEQRVEKLAIAFEEAKPYFVSRWRWPDRFNP